MRLIDWIKNLLAHEEPSPRRPAWHPGVQVPPKPRRKRTEPEIVDFSADPGGRIVDGGPGKNVLVRNKYVREDTGTHETLKIVDDSILETDEEFGSDPYNTGRFDRSRNWDSFRSRK